MAKYRCKTCQGGYTSPLRDGALYFHVCSLAHNPAYAAQFTLDAEGNLVPKGVLNPNIPPFIPRPNARDENWTIGPQGKPVPKNDGPGKDTIP